MIHHSIASGSIRPALPSTAGRAPARGVRRFSREWRPSGLGRRDRLIEGHALECLVQAGCDEPLPTGDGVTEPWAHPRLARQRCEDLPLSSDIRAGREVLQPPVYVGACLRAP